MAEPRAGKKGKVRGGGEEDSNIQMWRQTFASGIIRRMHKVPGRGRYCFRLGELEDGECLRWDFQRVLMAENGMEI